MNKKNIRLFSGCLLVLLCISALTGCGGSSSGTSTNSPGTNPSSGGPFTVRFDSKGGASVESQVVNGRLKLAKPDDPYTPDKPDFYFDGWYTSTAYSDKWDFDNDIVTSNLTLYGHWIPATSDGIIYVYDEIDVAYYVKTANADSNGDIQGDGIVYVPGYHNDGVHGTRKVIGIADSGFIREEGLKAIYLSDCLEYLYDDSASGGATFRSCTGLTSIVLPDSIKIIPVSAFNDCKNLESVVLPSDVYKIDTSAFRNTALSSIDIPGTVLHIDDTAFSGCSNLTTVNIYRAEPPAIGNNVFVDCTNLTEIRVPTESLNKYRSATGWKDYYDKIVGW